jgi:phage gp36-like protein
MAWQTISIDNVKTRLAGAEVAALQESALSAGQADPLPEIVEGAVDEVRGYISAASYILEAGSTVPSRLVNATLAIIRHRIATRLPGRSFLNEDRIREYQDAIRLLEQVASGKFALEAPVTADTEVSGGPAPSFTAKTRVFTSEDEDGI